MTVLIGSTPILNTSLVGVYPLLRPLLVGVANLPACGPLASFSVHLANSAVTPAGSVHKFSGAYVGAVEEMMCDVCVDVTEGA